jgi:hypothetical protein
MKEQVERIRKTRAYILDSVKELGMEQLNKIPRGFNNNIVWNLGHLVAAQQGVCYVRAGLNPRVEERFFDEFKNGSRPERPFGEEELTKIKELMFSSLDVLIQDYENGLWTSYSPWITRYGVELKNIDDAINFLTFHEGLHLGYILALKRLV